MKHRLVTLFALVSLMALSGAYAVDDEIDHLIPPGYTPEEARDEQGLWLEFEQLETQVNKSALLVTDPALNDYVGRIVCRVAADYCDDFRVYLIRNPGFNASMTATGMMQIWTGLIVRASSTDEIAAVIGHEIAHYTRLHSLEGFRALKNKMSRSSFLDLGLAVVTGIYGIAQMSAALSWLKFSREQETEADLLGLKILAQAGYDPHASYRVWQQIISEETGAVVKREDFGIFAQTHPDSADRMTALKSLVESRYGPAEDEPVIDQDLLDVLNSHYLFLMEDQIDTNRFGRTKVILERHAAMGVEPGLVSFFYGEMYRQRAETGDAELAMAAYQASVDTGNAPPGAYKNLGYLHLKKKELESARENFRQYLNLDPAASDRAMIEFYLEE